MNIDISNWKPFLIYELFTSKTGSTDIQVKDINGEGIVVLSSGKNDMGIIGKTDLPAEIIPSNTITVDMFGAVFYRNFPYKMVTHSRIFALIPKFKMSALIGLFMSTLLTRLVEMYSFTDMCCWNKIKNNAILLPVQADETPDWQYIEKYIIKLMDVVESNFFVLQSLIDKSHTHTHTHTLNEFDTSTWKEFSLMDLDFVNYHGKRLTKSNRISGEIPLLTAGEENNGVADYIGNDVPIYHNPITIDMFGNAFYHNGDYAGDDNIYFLVNDKISIYAKLFITAVINAKINSLFSYEDQFRQEDLNNLKIKLPITKLNAPDYEYMENLIKNLINEVEEDCVTLQTFVAA